LNGVGLAAMLGLIALLRQNQMLRIVFAVLKSSQPYHYRAVDYEASSVQRNAPRWMKMLLRHGFLEAGASPVTAA
jgi:hypothetical protein